MEESPLCQKNKKKCNDKIYIGYNKYAVQRENTILIFARIRRIRSIHEVFKGWQNNLYDKKKS